MISDEKYQVQLSIKKDQKALIGMVMHQLVGDKPFTRGFFSALEHDDTSRPVIIAPFEVDIEYSANHCKGRGMKVLVTGAAGFIGSDLSQRLLERGDEVIGIDNHNDYYSPVLKEARLARQASHPNYTHERVDLADRQGLGGSGPHAPACCKSGCTSRCTLFPRKSVVIHRQQYRGLCSYPRGVPPP